MRDSFIDLLTMIYSQLYFQRTGIARRITKSDALDIAVNKTIKMVLAEIRKSEEEQGQER